MFLLTSAGQLKSGPPGSRSQPRPFLAERPHRFLSLSHHRFPHLGKETNTHFTAGESPGRMAAHASCPIPVALTTRKPFLIEDTPRTRGPVCTAPRKELYDDETGSPRRAGAAPCLTLGDAALSTWTHSARFPQPLSVLGMAMETTC